MTKPPGPIDGFPLGAAIVAGGSGGLGSAICLALGAAGCPVIVGFRERADSADALARTINDGGGRAEAARIDLLDEDSLAAVVATAEELAGGVAAAVYAAGFRKQFDFVSRVPDALWERTLALDVRGFLALARVTIPALRRSHGSLVAITTYQAARLEVKGALSSVSKAAVEKAVMAIACEEGRYGVRANAVRTGWIEAGSAGALLDDETRARKQREIPLGRVGRPEELAAVVTFLASRSAGFVTGAAIPVDGGESL